jgi:chemotaxis protein methyltransferase CheR
MSLSQHSFNAITDMFHRVSGIRLTEAKRSLVTGRLQKLAHERGIDSLDQYVEQLLHSGDDLQIVQVVDKLTTNETYFFREPQHFDYLAKLVDERPRGAPELRIWSAASSSGEEGYSIAMLLGTMLGLNGWKIVGTDLSTAMVDTARRALYPMERARNMPPAYLKRWCMKGQGAHEGHLLINKELRAKLSFECANLTQKLPEIGHFDVIFLRNVLIYFDPPGKTDIIKRVLTRLKPDGLLFTGHAESITNLDVPVRAVAPAVYAHV